MPKSGSGVLFHVTPSSNVYSIEQNGIDPSYSQGARKVSWYATKRNIQRLAGHVSAVHHEAVDCLTVCAVHVDWSDMKGTAWDGIFYTYVTHKPESYTPAEHFFPEMMESDSDYE